MPDGGSNATNRPAPTGIDLNFEVPNASGPNGLAVDSRLRLGTPRSNTATSTKNEADFIQQVVLRPLNATEAPVFANGKTVLPEMTDDHADLKRSLRYDGPSGFGIITNGQLLKYLGGDEVTRIVDGSFRVYAIDLPPQGDDGNRPSAPSLSYLRLGKPEPKLGTGDQGQPVEGSGTQLPKLYDRSRDTKHSSGIGIYTEGDIQGYSKGKTSLRASGPFYINSRGYVLTSYGERKAVSYDISNESDLNDINAGKIDDTDVDRTLINVDWRYKRPDGWYTQVYDRGKRLDLYTSHKGEIGTSVKYTLSLGLAFNHSISAGLETGYSATVEIKGSSGIKVTENGFESDTLFGKFSVADSVQMAANGSVEISCAKLVDVEMTATMKIFSIAAKVAVAAQNAAFLAYEAALAAKANTTLHAGETTDDLMAEDHNGFQTAFEQGPKVYNAAISLSSITCAAGILLAAVQAAKSVLPDPELTPKIKMTPFGMVLSAGPMTKVTLNAFGIILRGGQINLRAVEVATGAPKASFSVA